MLLGVQFQCTFLFLFVEGCDAFVEVGIQVDVVLVCSQLRSNPVLECHQAVVGVGFGQCKEYATHTGEYLAAVVQCEDGVFERRGFRVPDDRVYFQVLLFDALQEGGFVVFEAYPAEVRRSIGCLELGQEGVGRGVLLLTACTNQATHGCCNH